MAIPYILDNVPFIEIVNVTLPQLITQKTQLGDDAFYVINLKTIIEKYNQWKQELPMVTPYYAVKCNPDPVILSLLTRLGCNFDCASKYEIEQVLDLNVRPDQIIYANPTKMVSHIEYARQVQVKLMTFDNSDELEKIAKCYPEAELVLRIVTDDREAKCRFSSKFGARLNDCPSLFEKGKSLGLNIVGVSFHVGSGGASSNSFLKALYNCKNILDVGKTYGFSMRLLDIGGGFPGDSHNFKQIASSIRPVLENLFSDIQIIAEPGRYFVTESHTLVCSIFARRIIDDSQILYYVADGVYQSFNCILYDHVEPQVHLLNRPDNDKIYKSTIFGPTCDSLDCILKDIDLPRLEIGDWVYFPNMGAYTVAAASNFNSFQVPKKYYYHS